MDEELKRLKTIVSKIENKTGKKFKSLNLNLSLVDEGFPLDSFKSRDIKIKDLNDLKGDYPFDDTIYIDYEDEAIEVAIKENLDYVKKDKVEARKKLKTLGNSKADKKEEKKQKEILDRPENFHLNFSEDIFLWLNLKTITFGDVSYDLEDFDEEETLEKYLTEEELGDFLTILEEKTLPKNISSFAIATYNNRQDEKQQKANKKKQDINR